MHQVIGIITHILYHLVKYRHCVTFSGISDIFSWVACDDLTWTDPLINTQLSSKAVHFTHNLYIDIHIMYWHYISYSFQHRNDATIYFNCFTARKHMQVYLWMTTGYTMITVWDLYQSKHMQSYCEETAV